MADWFVYQHDGAHLGPWSSEHIASSILSGQLPPDAWIAAPNGDRWLRAHDVPVIAALINGMPTRPRRRESGLRLVPGTYKEGDDGAFRSTVMMVDASALDPTVPSAEFPVETRAATRTAFEATETMDDVPVTERSMPPPAPSSPTPSSPAPEYRGDGDTLASPTLRRRRKNG